MPSVSDSLDALNQNVHGALSKLSTRVNQSSVSVSRPEESQGSVYVGDVVDFTIVNYDSEIEYVLGASHGSIELVQVDHMVNLEKIGVRHVARLTTPTDYDGPITVTINSRTIEITVETKRIAKPNIVSITSGQTDVAIGYAMSASAFVSKPAGEYVHDHTDWQIATDAGFTSLAVDVVASTTDLESLILPDSLDDDTLYYTRVRYGQSGGEYSEWSEIISFTTANTDIQGNEIQVLYPAVSNGYFGGVVKVSASGEWMVVGSIRGDRITMFKQVGQTWVEMQDIPVDDFGTNTPHNCIDISGDGTVVVVGHYKYTDTFTYQGKITTYRRSGDVWSVGETFSDTAPAENDHYGHAVSLNYDGSRLVTRNGRTVAGTSDLGEVILLEYQTDTWVELERFTRVRAGGVGNFGTTLKLSNAGDVLAIGSASSYHHSSTSIYCGALTIIRESGGVWTSLGDFYPTTNHGGGVGHALDITPDGGVVLVSAPQADSNGQDAGSAYTYTYNGTTYEKGTVAHGTSGSRLGHSLSLSADGEKALLGAFQGRAADNTQSGVAWVMENSGGTWTLSVALEPDTPAASEQFGVACDMPANGSIAFVGAHYNTDQGGGAGAVYIFA